MISVPQGSCDIDIIFVSRMRIEVNTKMPGVRPSGLLSALTYTNLARFLCEMDIKVVY